MTIVMVISSMAKLMLLSPKLAHTLISFNTINKIAKVGSVWMSVFDQ